MTCCVVVLDKKQRSAQRRVCAARVVKTGNWNPQHQHRNPASRLSTTKSSARIRGAAWLSGEGSLSGNSNKERDVDSGDVEDDENVKQHHESASPEAQTLSKTSSIWELSAQLPCSSVETEIPFEEATKKGWVQFTVSKKKKTSRW